MGSVFIFLIKTLCSYFAIPNSCDTSDNLELFGDNRAGVFWRTASVVRLFLSKNMEEMGNG